MVHKKNDRRGDATCGSWSGWGRWTRGRCTRAGRSSGDATRAAWPPKVLSSGVERREQNAREVAPNLTTLTRAEVLCCELRPAWLSCEVQDDEVTMLWSKLCFLAPFALTTTASGDTLGAVRSDASWDYRLKSCVAEACSVTIAEGAKLTPQPVLAALEGAPNALRSSMQKDVAAGRAPGLDAIAGPILRGGSKYGIDVSTTQTLVNNIVRAM